MLHWNASRSELSTEVFLGKIFSSSLWNLRFRTQSVWMPHTGQQYALLNNVSSRTLNLLRKFRRAAELKVLVLAQRDDTLLSPRCVKEHQRNEGRKENESPEWGALSPLERFISYLSNEVSHIEDIQPDIALEACLPIEKWSSQKFIFRFSSKSLLFDCDCRS